jgi:hypothetical protein
VPPVGRSWVRRAAPIVYLFAISLAMSAAHTAQYRAISPIDELRHIDYAMQVTDFDLVKLGDHLSQEAMRVEACRGADQPQPDPPCHTRHFDARDFRDDGFQTASAHPPTYYATVGFVSRALVGLGIFHDFVDPARLMGGMLLGLGLVFTYLAGVMLGVRRCALLAALTIVPTASALMHATSTVNPDAASVLAGGLVLLAAVMWEQGRLRMPWLIAAGALATGIKFTNLLAVVAVAIWFVARSPAADTVVDKVEDWWRRSRFGKQQDEPTEPVSEVSEAETASIATAQERRPLRIRAAVYLSAGAVGSAALWAFIDRLRATIDPSIVPQNRALAAHGFPDIGTIFTSPAAYFNVPTIFTWLPPVDGYDPPYLANLTVSNFRIITVLLFAGAMIIACLRVSRRSPVLILGAVGAFVAIAGGPAFLLMNYFVSNVISPPNGRYGMSLLPVMVVVLAGWVRTKSAVVLLWSVTGAAFLAQLIAILQANVPSHLVR